MLLHQEPSAVGLQFRPRTTPTEVGSITVILTYQMTCPTTPDSAWGRNGKFVLVTCRFHRFSFVLDATIRSTEDTMKFMLLIQQGTTPTPQDPEAWGRLSEEEQKA